MGGWADGRGGEWATTHFQVAIVVNEQIFGFEVPVDQVQGVQILEGEHNLSGVEAGMRFREAANPTQVGEHLAAAHKFQHHVEVGIVLRRVGE